MFNPLLLLLVVGLPVIAQDNRPQDPNNYFVYPPLPGPQFSNDPTVFETNHNFTVGEQQDQPFKWETNMTSVSILLIQEGNPESVQQHDLTDCIPGSTKYFYWDGSIGPIDLKNGSRAFLGAYNCSHPTTPIFFSHYINLIEAQSEAEVSSSSIVSSTKTSSFSISFSTLLATTATSSATISPTPTPTPLSAPASATPSPENPSNAATIGGGIGGGIGGALLLIAVGYAFWKYRGRKRDSAQQQQQQQQQPNWANGRDDDVLAHKYNSSLYKQPHPIEIYSSPNIGHGMNPGRRFYEVE